jgi:hypothetical protein
MAKIIRLTERDLHLIIKNVIREQNEATIAQYKQIFVNSGKIDEDVYDEIVLSNTKILPKQLKQIHKERKEWYITSEEALELGIIDEIL